MFYLGILLTASQRQKVAQLPEGKWDRPPKARERDVTGQFLVMTFVKSPWMKLETLIKSNPKLEMLWGKCAHGQFQNGGATFLLKEGLLLRKHTTAGLETIQVCLSSAFAYSLCLRATAHVRDGRGTWKSPMQPSLHNGPRKLHNLISARFYVRAVGVVFPGVWSLMSWLKYMKHSTKGRRLFNLSLSPMLGQKPPDK